MERLLIYSHDTFGLGNMHRMTAIVEHLTRENQQLNILMISGSSALPAFQLPDRMDYVKLPCLHRDVAGHYSAKSLNIELESIIRMRANLILNTALDFKPDLIVVDKKPFGVANELEPVLSVLGRRINPPRMVLLLRDILDDAETTHEIWNRNDYHGVIDRYYESVLVVGDQNVYDLGEEYRFPTSTRTRTQYCGYIRKSDDIPLSDPAGNPSNNHPAVLVTPGGGEDGERLLSTFIESIAEQKPNYQSLVILGPDLKENTCRQLELLTRKDSSITCQRFTRHMSHHMNQAQVLVTMGGYNTIIEGLSLQKPMVVVPRTNPSREQEIRARRLSELGFLQCLLPSELTPGRLRQSIEQSLTRPIRELPEINFDGLRNVNRQVQFLCGQAA